MFFELSGNMHSVVEWPSRNTLVGVSEALDSRPAVRLLRRGGAGGQPGSQMPFRPSLWMGFAQVCRSLAEAMPIVRFGRGTHSR